MKIIKRYFLLMFFLFFNTIFSQNEVLQLKDSTTKYLYNNIEKTTYFNSKLYKISLEKKDNQGLILSYIYSAITNELSNNLDSTIFYYQKGLDISKTPNNIIDFKYSIGVIYEAKRDYEKALRLYNESLILARKHKLTDKKEDIRLSIISIRNKINGTLESIPELKAAYNKYADNKSYVRYIRKKLIDGYVANGLYDKALSYIEEGLEEAETTNNSEYKYYLNLLKGKCFLNKKDYDLSINALNIAIIHAKKFNNNLFLDNTNYVLAKVKHKQGKTNESIDLVRTILDREGQKSPDERSKYYNLLAENYKQLDSTSLSNNYYQKAILEREKASLERIETLENIYKISLGEETLETEVQKNKKRIWIIAFTLLLFIAVLLYFINRATKRKNNKAFEALLLRVKDYENREPNLDIDRVLNSLSNEGSIEKPDKGQVIEALEETKSNKFVIDNKKVSNILKKVKKQEEELYFIRKDCNLHNMAKTIGTNTSYLSKIINEHLDKTFSKYINDLRINYAVIELKNNRRLRAYSVAAIAEEMGYKNADSFSKSFKTITGISPSVYIKKIKSIKKA